MTDFYKGMDISFVPELLDEGMQIYDLGGTPIAPLALAKKYGVNSIRLRIWNDPENVREAKGYCSLKHTMDMAKQIKSYGLGFMLDFHYSDYWADPEKQRKPKAWEGLCFEELQDAVYQYTKDTLITLKEADVLPEIVQIGNEIRSGLLFPDGELPDYEGMVKLVNAGIRGAREAAGPDEMKIMIHLDQGGRYFYLKEWFDRSIAHGLDDFDIIGLSYYPFWHGTFMDLKESMEKLIQDYRKPIIIAETAHAWRRSKNGYIDEAQERIAGFPATPEGQKKVLDLVMNITAAIPDLMGIGVYYWEPLCVPREGDGGWGENMGILDESGRVHESIKAFLFTRDQQQFKEAAKIYDPKQMILLKGSKPLLPEELNVLYYDGSIRKHSVWWTGCFSDTADIPDKECVQENENVPDNEYLKENTNVPCEKQPQNNQDLVDREWINQPGEYWLSGEIEEISLKTSMKVKVVEQLEESENLIRDENWEEGFTQWILEKSDERVTAQLLPEQVVPFPAPPVNQVRVESPMNFHFTIYQDVTIQTPGRYKLQVEYRGTDTTNVDVRMFVEYMEERHSKRKENISLEEEHSMDSWKEQIIHPTDDDWVLHEIENIECRPGILKVGIRISAPPIFGQIRQFRLVQCCNGK